MRIPQAAAARDEAGPGPAGYVNTVMSPAGGLLAEVGDGVCVPVMSSGVSQWGLAPTQRALCYQLFVVSLLECQWLTVK